MDFEIWKEFYNWGMATKKQLQQAVALGMLTQEQYNDILGIKPIVQPEVKATITNQENPKDEAKKSVLEPQTESTTTTVNVEQDVKPEETETKKNIQIEQPIVTQ